MIDRVVRFSEEASAPFFFGVVDGPGAGVVGLVATVGPPVTVGPDPAGFVVGAGVGAAVGFGVVAAGGSAAMIKAQTAKRTDT